MKLQHIKIFLCLSLGLSATLDSQAQIDSLVFNTVSQAVDANEKNELRFDVQALAFFKDNEYNSKDVIKGYTLPGVWITPSVSYQPLQNLKFEVGAYMLHYWGADRYPTSNIENITIAEDQKTTKAFHCVPVFRANLQISPKVNIILGTLYGKAFHELTEPLYNEERSFTTDPETGIQVVWNNNWLHFDTWVDWQKFIYKKDDKQEEFTYGMSARFTPKHKANASYVYFPLQLLMHHIGGEINTEAQERSIKTWLNAAAGVGINIPLKTQTPVVLNGEITAHYYSQQKGATLPYNKGYGIFAKLQAKVWNFCATASYWHSNQFISIYGSSLYNAISNVDDNTYISHPKMFTLKGEYAQNIGRGFSWGVGLTYDLHSQKHFYHSDTQTYSKGKLTSDLSAGIYLRLHPSFLIKKFKTNQTH